MVKELERKNRGGRPTKEVDEKLIFDLAKIHCTKEEIASIVGICVETLYKRFSDVLRHGDDEGKKSLKRKMHEIAEKGNVQMLIWLSKQRLGYRDRQPDEAPQTIINVQVLDTP